MITIGKLIGSQTLSRIVFWMFFFLTVVIYFVGFIFKQYLLPRATEREMLQQIVEKHRLISASLASHLSAGDWIAVQRFISAANSKSEKEISYVIDFTGAVIGGTRVSAKLSPEVLRGLAGCAEVSWECPLLSGQFNLPLSHNPEQVRYFVSTPFPFGGNNVSYLVTIVDLTKFVNSEVRNLFVPLLVTLLVIVMLLSLLMYIGLVNYIINPLRHLTVLFEKKELHSKDLLINKTERFPKEVQNVYSNLQKYLLRLEAETIKNEQMQKEMLAAKRTEAIAQMTQMLAHDVRRPFSMLKSLLEGISKAKTPAQVQLFASMGLPETIQAMNYVNGLIQDVMEIGTNSQIQLSPTKPESLLEAAFGETFQAFPDAHVSISYRLNHNTHVNVEERKILRVMANIIGNALQAMKQQGTIRIETSPDEVGGRSFVKFVFANNGPPIAAAHLPKLFEAFFTNGKQGGTGLGLAIAHKMVTAHGGKIWCESSPEIGVEFHFTLPAIGPELVPDVRALPKNSQEIGGRIKSFGAMLPEGDGPTQHELSCKK